MLLFWPLTGYFHGWRHRYLASHGVRDIELLGRSGRLGADGGGDHLTGLLTGDWSGAVTITKCDTASAEDMRAVMAGCGSAGGSAGQGGTFNSCGRAFPAFNAV